MKSLILLGIVLTQSLALAVPVQKSFDAQDLTTLEVHNLSGCISIEASPDQVARVKASKKSWKKGCVLKTEKEFEVLKVKVEDKGTNSFGRKNCEVSFEIQIPSRAQLKIKNGSGDVLVSGIRGEIDFKLGSGDLKINSTTSKVNGTAGSGDIEIVGEVGATSLRTGSGDIKIIYNNPIDEGLIDIKTGSGDADISLPPTMKILTDFKAGSGDVESEFGSDQEAKFKVSMRAGSGDLKIRKK